MSNPKNPNTHRMAADYQNHREWLQAIRAQLMERAGILSITLLASGLPISDLARPTRTAGIQLTGQGKQKN